MDVAPGAPFLVIRTSQDYRYDNFLSMLQVQCGDLWASGFPIDFIYLPCPRVGIINFVNHELCWMCFDVITRRMQMGTIRIIKVQQAMYQGLQTNLAVYYAKAGRRGLERKNAPKVFLEGQELPLRQALKSFVAPELIQHYRASFRSSTEASAAPGSENQDGRGWAGRTAQSVPVNLPPEQARRQPSSSSWVPVWQTQCWDQECAYAPRPGTQQVHRCQQPHASPNRIAATSLGGDMHGVARPPAGNLRAEVYLSSSSAMVQEDGSWIFRL